jgi:hypothetical protein
MSAEAEAEVASRRIAGREERAEGQNANDPTRYHPQRIEYRRRASTSLRKVETDHFSPRHCIKNGRLTKE